jgi:hypothetical protein
MPFNGFHAWLPRFTKRRWVWCFQPASLAIGIMSMAIAGSADCVHDPCKLEAGSPRAAVLGRPTRKYLTICAISCTLIAAGCARNVAPNEFNPPVHSFKTVPVRVTTHPRRPARQAEPQTRRPDSALLVPQPAPDCEYNRSDIRTADPDEWARLKIEYERQCYKDAEKVARDRLSLLQASATGEVELASQPSRVPRRSE